MTRSRKYLYNLPNAEKIKQLAEEILECELKLDRAISDNKKNKKNILALETEIMSLDKTEDPEIIKKMKKRLEELSEDIISKDGEIDSCKKRILDLKSLADDQIREGLSQLFNQAKSCVNEAQQSLLEHEKLANEAQNRLTNSSSNQSRKYRDEWILNVEKTIRDEEKLKKCEKQLEAIKRVYKREFG
jgi:hypothetical protein